MVPRTAILGLSRTNLTIRGVFAMTTSASEINYTCLSEGKQDHPVYLSDISPNDKPWDIHKAEGEEMQKLLAGVEGDDIEKIRERMAECGEWLIFNHTTPDARGKTFKLHEAHFCRVRTCPYCQWRRSLLYTAKMLEAVPKIFESSPTIRLIHLTLTVRNVGIGDLRGTIGELNRAWHRMTMRKPVRQILKGFVKSLEVTRGEDGTAHPHIHALLLVPEFYFKIKRYYIRQESWVQLWKEALRLDYSPSVSVQACRQAQGYERIIREIVKYSTKPQDLLRDAEWLVSYIRQVRNLRFFSTGGIVKDALGELEQEREDLIGVGEDQAQDDANVLAQSWFDWKKETARYQHRETRLNPSIPTNHSAPGGGGGSGGGS